MAKKKDLKSLGDVYSKLGDEVVVEEKNDMTVGDKDAAVGEAPLEDGGAKDDAEVDAPEEVECAKAEEVQEVESAKEEDEESSAEALENAQGGINNYMAKKSAFDELFAKVISEDFGMEEQDDLNALGIEDATPDAELGEEGDDDDTSEEEITVTLDKELAKTLCDLLKAAMGEEETDDAGDEDVADELEGDDDQFGPEEDNEGAPQAHTTHVDMGENNKVGHAEFASAPAVQAANKVEKPAAGSDQPDGKPQPLGDSVKNDQKVGAKTEGPTTTVQPKNKEVKAG